MDRKLKTATTTLGVLAGLFALGATIYAARNKTTLNVQPTVSSVDANQSLMNGPHK